MNEDWTIIWNFVSSYWYWVAIWVVGVGFVSATISNVTDDSNTPIVRVLIVLGAFLLCILIALIMIYNKLP
jgi:hypothetical protein